MKIIKVSLISISIIFISLIILLTLFIGDVVKKGVVSVAPDILGVSVTVDDVNISLIDGTAKISGLTVGNPAGFKTERAFYLSEIDISLEPLSVFSDVIKINHIKIVEPEITYEIGVGKTNIQEIQNNISVNSNSKTKSETTSVPNETKSSKKVIVDEVIVSDAKVKAGVGQISKEVVIPEIKIVGIGKEGSPASFAATTKRILSAVIKAIAESDVSSIKGELLKKIEGIGSPITEGIKSIFK